MIDIVRSGGQRQTLSLGTPFGSVQTLEIGETNNQILFGGQEGALGIYDLESRKVVKWFRGHSNYVRSAVWSPDSKFVASTGSDKTVRIWGVANGSEILRMDLPSHGKTIGFSADGRRILSGSTDSGIRIWDASSGVLIKHIDTKEDWVLDVQEVLSNKTILSVHYSGYVILWDQETGLELNRYRREPKSALAQVVRDAVGLILGFSSMDINTQRDRVAIGANDGELVIMDISQWRILSQWRAHSEHIHCVRWSVTDNQLITSGRDGTVAVWEIPDE